MSAFYCSGCWAHIVAAVSNPPPHKHSPGCYERHRVFGERLSPVLVARESEEGERHECVWRDCKDGGRFRARTPAKETTDDR